MPASDAAGGVCGRMPEEADIATCKHAADVRLFSILPTRLPAIPDRKPTLSG